MITLDIPSKLAVRALTSVQSAQLSGSKVSGKFENSPTDVAPTGEPRLIETFLNWLDAPDAILRFTRIYGPLKEEPVAGGKFEFDLKEFREVQE